ETGMLVYQPNAGVLSRQVTVFGIDGSKMGVIGEAGPFAAGVTISPDGRKAAMNWGDASGRTAIWIYDLPTGVPTRLTFGSTQPAPLPCAPDGRSRGFSTDGGDVGVVAATGAAQPRIVWSADRPAVYSVNGWSPDGMSLAVIRQSVGGIDIVGLP